MPKSIITTAIGTSITIATAGTIVSILAGAVTIVYTSMKIIDWIQMRRLKKLRRQLQIKRLEDSG